MRNKSPRWLVFHSVKSLIDGSDGGLDGLEFLGCPKILRVFPIRYEISLLRLMSNSFN